jgi:hypothetical protein
MAYSKSGPNSLCRKHGTHPLKFCKDPGPTPTPAQTLAAIRAMLPVPEAQPQAQTNFPVEPEAPQ